MHIIDLLTIGNLASAFQLGIIFDGMVDQIRINRQLGSTKGMSARKQYWTVGACILWILTGLHDGTYYIVYPQIPCITFALYTIGQVHYYNHINRQPSALAVAPHLS